ncbi:MAG: hypothetical protein RIR10_2082, partial [Planctomycetota bacterium]
MLKTNATQKSASARAIALLALTAPIIGFVVVGGLAGAAAGARGRVSAPSASSLASASTAAPRVSLSRARPDFDRDIRPILAAKCFACHGPDAESRKAGLRLDTFEGATAALENGVRAIAPGTPETSMLLARVSSTDLDDRMPPEGHDALTATEIASLRAWISSGAEYTAPWAFRPLADAAIPAVADESWAKSDIDRFVLAT